VKLYQGVTLGALSFPKDERGRLIRGYKRHPSVMDRVTIYANATVLGGETVLGENSMVGASVFLTSSIPDNAMVRLKDPELRVRKIRPAGEVEPEPDWALDFQI
jgi:serine O-acetyltransferase